MIDAPFGREWLACWALDPKGTYLNHGTVGAPPRRALEAQSRIRAEIEAQPSRFLLRELTSVNDRSSRPVPRMREAANAVAAFLGAKGDDLAFVNNVTTGINAILRSLEFAPGDEILLTDHAYGAVRSTAEYVARRAGAIVRAVKLPYPVGEPAEIVEFFAEAIGSQTRLLIADHVTSETALVLPIREIVAAAHAKGVRVIVDGAHAPGAIPVDIESIGADWYAANLHKWGWTPRSLGILWAPPASQKELHPTVISWGLDQGFAMEFDWVGTFDPTAALAAPEALAYMKEIGVDRVRAYNHGLAWHAATSLSQRWGTTLPMDERWVGTMATVPLPRGLGSTQDDANRVRDSLLEEEAIEIPLKARDGALFARISAQIYNDQSDLDRLATALESRLAATR